MSKEKEQRRFCCVYCGTKRYAKFLNHTYINGVKYRQCKNEDFCVLKMSLNKKLLKK